MVNRKKSFEKLHFRPFILSDFVLHCTCTHISLHKYLLFVYFVNFEAMKVKHKKKMYLTITNVQVLNIQLEFKRLFSNNQVSFLLDFKLDVNVKVYTLFETLKCFILMTELKQAHLISSSSTLQSHKCNPAVRHEHAHTLTSSESCQKSKASS